MVEWLRSWKGGVALAATCLVLGLVRLFSAPLDGLTGTFFLLALGYAGAALVERRVRHARRALSRPAGVDPAPWSTQPSRVAAWLGAERGRADDVDRHTGPAMGGGVPLVTKDRVGALLAIAAAVVGLVLVFHEREPGMSAEDRGPATLGSIGQVVPASPGSDVVRAFDGDDR